MHRSREIGICVEQHEIMTLLDASLRRLGIEGLGEVPWGTHFCLFYTTEEDLLDLLVPYFKTGLEDHEFCLWVAETPKEVEYARQAMRESVPNFEQYVTEGQVEFVTYAGWYLSNGYFDSRRVIQRWIDRLEQVLDKGYARGQPPAPRLRCTRHRR